MLEEDRTNAMAALAAPGSAEHKSGGERLPDSLLLDGRSQAEAGKEYWRGARTGYTRPTLASLRAHSQPGSQKAGTASPRSGSHPTSRPPHPLARARSATRSVSGSDSDETLVEPWTEKEVTDYLLSRTLTPTDVRRPEELVRPTKGGVGKLAEILWILRPLLYGMLLC